MSVSKYGSYLLITDARTLIKKSLLTITLFILSILFYLGYDLWSYQSERSAFVHTVGQNSINELKRDIQAVLLNVEKTANVLRSEIEGRSLSEEELSELISSTAVSVDDVLGITVAYEPYGWSPEKKLYSQYFDKNKEKFINIESVYDYTDISLPTSQWYVQVRDNGADWVEPYYAKAAEALVADYGIPFYYLDGEKKGKVHGTITMTLSLKGFSQSVQNLSLGKTGYGFVASQRNIILAHPVGEFVGVKSLDDLANGASNEKMRKAYQAMATQKQGYKTFYDSQRDQQVSVYFDEIKLSGWQVGVSFLRQDVLSAINVSIDSTKRKVINLALCLSILFVLIVTIIFNRDYLSTTEIWVLSLIASVMLVANTLLIGVLQHASNVDERKIHSPPLVNNVVLGAMIDDVSARGLKLNSERPMQVPFGMFLERIEFKDSYNVNLSGKAWVKLPKDEPVEDTPLFRFPQTAPFAEASLIEESYREAYPTFTLVGYTFRTTMRLNFNYSEYPFDKRHMAIEIRPDDINNNMLLVPDLDGYAFTNPSDKLGINKDVHLPGSRVLESYFSYESFGYDTRFGYSAEQYVEGIPSLLFNINVKRKLVTSFVTYLIPIFVSLIMIFIMLCSAERSKDLLLGGGIVQGLAAFFFVLIFSHIDLRKDILTGELVYLEYYYFAAYLMIIITAVNLIFYTRGRGPIVDYHDNIAIKAMYWPLFFSFTFCVTWLKFY